MMFCTEFKKLFLLRMLSCFFLLIIGQNQYAQKELLIESQKLYKEHKFKEALPLINKVVKHNDTKHNSHAFNLRGLIYFHLFKAETTYNSSKINLLDSAIHSVLLSLNLDSTSAYKASNFSILKNGAESYYKISLVLLKDSLNSAKSRRCFLNFIKYTYLYDPKFDFKEIEIDYYNKRGTFFLDFYLKHDYNDTHADLAKMAFMRVLELDQHNALAQENLAVLQNHQNHLLDEERNHLITLEINKIEDKNKSEIQSKELTIESLNKSQTRYHTELKNQKDENHKKTEEIKVISQEKEFHENESEKNRQVKNLIFVVLVLVIAFTVFVVLNLIKNKKAKKLITAQKELIEEKQKEILESISYAKYLQEAILPSQDFLNQNFPNNFVIYKPKDIVAGDFYWSEKVNDLFFIAVADSTGHGVPGAMISIVCNNALNRAIKEFNLTDTGLILDKTRELVIATFEKSRNKVKDGMDISLLCIDYLNKKITWSGANNPLWYVYNNELKVIKANKQPIGNAERLEPFISHEIEYLDDTTFYLFTDGFADQFGGEKGKKFMYKQFSELLLSNNKVALNQQAVIINDVFEKWKSNVEQVDDVCVMGIKI
jgi:serine phosphatase RsbU (regulator of sigma subunit)